MHVARDRGWRFFTLAARLQVPRSKRTGDAWTYFGVLDMGKYVGLNNYQDHLELCLRHLILQQYLEYGTRTFAVIKMPHGSRLSEEYDRKQACRAPSTRAPRALGSPWDLRELSRPY